MNERMQRDYAEALFWLILMSLVADILGWLGPRECPRCQKPRTLADRIRGTHECGKINMP